MSGRGRNEGEQRGGETMSTSDLQCMSGRVVRPGDVVTVAVYCGYVRRQYNANYVGPEGNARGYVRVRNIPGGGSVPVPECCVTDNN